MNLYSPRFQDKDVDSTFNFVCDCLLGAPGVDTGHWQGKKGTPMSQTRELLNCIFEIPIAATPGSWASFMKPNLPWAEDHFQERVSGKPWNPPPSHVDWPFNQAANKDHMDGEVFSHSYPERLWPQYAPQTTDMINGGFREGRPNRGIRYRYGDLDDLLDVLVREPFTRQSYVPLWFPEDIAAANLGQRVPCTLGYHFIMRRNRLNLFYPMRSLDLLRYANDDFYMAGRLVHWVIDECVGRTDGEHSVWHDVQPGILTVHAVSVHCFEGDVPAIRHRLRKSQEKKVAA